MKLFIVTAGLLMIGFNSEAQEDSTQPKELTELIVTATRSERKLSNVAVPVQIITQKNISQSGSLRLNDILSEQTGLYITNASSANSTGGGVFGNGVQVQGLSPDYTLILIDGEPVVGRQGGVIDLSRMAVANLKKIEIVKGPSSSLYGSEAMGGVINLITEQPKSDQLNASLRWGRFNNADATINSSIKKDKWGMGLFINRNSSDGFDLNKTTPGNTVDPWKNYTSQIRVTYNPTIKTKINVSGRYYNEVQDNFFEFYDYGSGNNISISGNGKVRDLQVNPTVTQQFSDKLRSSLRFYFSHYQFEQDLQKNSDQSSYYYDFFSQNFFRVENQTDWHWQKNNYLNIGGGWIKEKLNTTRYNGERENETKYVFLQNEWRAYENFTIIGGIRFDDNAAYSSKLSPKLATQYKVNEKIRFNASYGAGFKAPDFRQMFLNFTNNAAGGYTIYGANEISIQQLEQQKQQGIISEILPRAYKLALLDPEISSGWNAGIHYDVNEKFSLSANFFRNDIKNLIQVEIIAYHNNQSPVFSYFNINRAFTQGAEMQLHYVVGKNFSLQGGYQFLMTADKDVLNKIKSGNEYARTIGTNQTYQLSRNEYAGLPNRSAHMANAKLFYENKKNGWSGSLRAIYRSRWGTTDKDGNGIINRNDEFANGFVLVNMLVAKKINSFNLQAGIDNLFNYTDITNLPGQPGIQPYLSISYLFTNNHKKKKS